MSWGCEDIEYHTDRNLDKTRCTERLFNPLKETEARNLLEIAEARCKKASTIFCSQFDIPGWREKIGNSMLADAICDRIVHDSYSILIEYKESMRNRGHLIYTLFRPAH